MWHLSDRLCSRLTDPSAGKEPGCGVGVHSASRWTETWLQLGCGAVGLFCSLCWRWDKNVLLAVPDDCHYSCHHIRNRVRSVLSWLGWSLSIWLNKNFKSKWTKTAKCDDKKSRLWLLLYHMPNITATANKMLTKMLKTSAFVYLCLNLKW